MTLSHDVLVFRTTRTMLEVAQSGCAGMLPCGKVVDRRYHEKASPIPENKRLGIPAPQPTKGWVW